MPRPATYYTYYNGTQSTQTFNYGGVSYTAPLSVLPPVSFQDNGYLYNELNGLPLQYWNCQMQAAPSWFQHLDQRLGVADVITTILSLSPTQMTEKYGGTWTNIGTKVFGGQTLNYWRKVT